MPFLHRKIAPHRSSRRSVRAATQTFHRSVRPWAAHLQPYTPRHMRAVRVHSTRRRSAQPQPLHLTFAAASHCRRDSGGSQEALAQETNLWPAYGPVWAPSQACRRAPSICTALQLPSFELASSWRCGATARRISCMQHTSFKGNKDCSAYLWAPRVFYPRRKE